MIDFFNTLTKLSKIASPTGRESNLSHAIEELARPYADEITTDALGNLIVHKRGSGDRVMFAAHMDTIGMIATHFDDNGYIRFGQLGGLPLADLHNIPITFLNGVPGVVSYDTKIELKDRKLHHFYIDIGATDKEDAKSRISLGEIAVYGGTPKRLGEHRIVSPYLDNRIAVVMLLMLLSELPQTTYDLYFVFTVQEEVGLRGARCAAYAIEPKFAIAVDVTDTGDLPESEIVMDTRLGAGCAIKIMDRSVVCHPKITKALQDSAMKHSIPYQNEIMVDGGTDAGEIHLSRGGVLTGGVSIPTRYIHSPCEIADLRDIDSGVKLLSLALSDQLFL